MNSLGALVTVLPTPFEPLVILGSLANSLANSLGALGEFLGRLGGSLANSLGALDEFLGSLGDGLAKSL